MSRPRYGYQRLTILLRRKGWHVNAKRVYRLSREEGLQVRIKRRKKLASEWFSSLEDARRSIKLWQQEYHTERPHSALGDLSPAEFVAQMQYPELKNVRPE